MIRGARAFLGAVAGALLVLLIHPRSRPFLLPQTLWPSTAREITSSKTLPENLPKLTWPESLDQASLWLQTGAEYDLSGQKLNVEQLLNLVEIADHGQTAEPDNAFWPQMKSVFVGRALNSIGQSKAPTIESWVRASRLTTWNDHQTQRLGQIVKSLERQTGSPFAWHQAVAYSRRSSAVGHKLLRHSRQLASEYPKDLAISVANVKNGILVRDGARSIAASAAGASMVEMAGFSHPESSGSLGSAKVTAESYGKLLRSVPLDDPSERQQLVDAFVSNAAWFAFVPVRDYADRSIDLTRRSMLVAILPSALLFSGLVGVAAYILGACVCVSKPVQKIFGPPWSALLGMLAGVVVLLASGLVFASLWSFLALALFCATSERARSSKPVGLGVVFLGTNAFLALAVAVALMIHVLEASATEQLLARAAALPVPGSGNSVVPLQLVFLGFSMVLATAPAWGFFYRYRPSVVLPESLRSFGAFLAIGGLSLAVLATPVCLLEDRKLSKELTELVQNEPNHYLVRTSGP